MSRRIPFILVLLTLSISFFSCDKVNLLELDSEVTVSNTLQTAADPAMGGTGGVETPIEAIFGLPAGALILTTSIGEGVEFVDYLDGLYDIDLSADQISYTLVASPDHPVYSNFFRTIEANTFDRYYFDFTEPHNIESAEANNSSVTLRVLSDTRIVVEISEGFSFNPGSTFTIDLN